MDLRRLRAFVTVSEELHFGRAAARLRIAQPALSQQIQKLETELGTRLLERDRHSVALTATGEVLQREARSVLAQWDFARERVELAKAGGRGLIRLAYRPGPCGALVGAALARHPADANPRVRWTEDNHLDLLERLADGKFDAALMPETVPPHPRGLAFTEICIQELRIVTATSHRLGKKRALPLEALRDDTFVVYSQKTAAGYRAWIQNLCRKAGFSARIGLEVTTVHELAVALGSGAFVALLTDGYEGTLPGKLAFHPVRPEVDTLPIRLWWRKSKPPAGIAELEKLLKTISGRR